MNYSLGNMLGGAGALNADKLALNLQFATDKTLTARKGPTPVFTRASTATFVGSDGLIQSAAINTARFDHDPITLACKGLLIEESRTNTLQQSEAFDATQWAASGTNLTATSNNITAPSGSLTADKLTVGATTTTYFVSQISPAFVSGTTYTLSCFFKANQVTRVAFYANTTTTFNANAIFDLTGSGSVVQNIAGTASITPYANGWYRCQITGISGASIPTAIRISPVTGTSLNYVGNSVDSFYAWGAQLEVGAFPTSYIPTTTASVVRSADICSITGSAFSGMYNATEGTSFVSAIRYTNLGNPRSLTITNGTSGNRAEQVRGTNVEQVDYYAGGSFLHNFSLSAATVGVNYKIAHAMAANNFAASMNGASPVVNNSGVMVTADRLIIGSNFQGSTGFHNGTISAIRYYKKRLANAKLQALTA